MRETKKFDRIIILGKKISGIKEIFEVKPSETAFNIIVLSPHNSLPFIIYFSCTTGNLSNKKFLYGL